MRLKKLKGRKHLQLVDSNGRITHIGPVKSKGMENCIENMFVGDYIMTFGIIRRYLEDEGYTGEEAKTRAIQYVSSQFKQKLDELVTEDVLEEVMGLMRHKNRETTIQGVKGIEQIVVPD
ncbi:MAG: hypothetical protein ACLFVP_08035 [Candidatus Bathyarchaeia archaeon]